MQRFVHDYLATVLLWLAPCLTLFGGSYAAGPLPGIDSSAKFLVYYGNDFADDTVELIGLFDVVVLNPNNSNVTPALVARIKATGVRYVVGYISIGEDQGTNLIVGNFDGPTYHDGTSVRLQSGGIASFYLDHEWNGTAYINDGIPDVNKKFNGWFVYPNDDWRWVINTQRIGGSIGLPTRSVVGLAQMADTRLSDSDTDRTHDFGFDGFFLDTLDTAGPFEGVTGYYAWAAEEMRNTVRFVHDTYPGKVLFANRGLFFHNPADRNARLDIKPYEFTIRPYIHALVFESYMLDSDIMNAGVSPYFTDNKYNYAPKLIAESNRVDGFTVFALDYELSRDSTYGDSALQETMLANGWPSYLAPDETLANISTRALDATMPVDQNQPVWDSTAALGYALDDVPDRVGVQAVMVGDAPGEVLVQWDIARDQSPPVRYNVYHSMYPAFATYTRYANVAYEIGAGWSDDPVSSSANQYEMSGLPAGTHYFRVTAEDSSAAALEDDNNVTLSVNVEGGPIPVLSNPVFKLRVDGDLSDWAELGAFPGDPDDISGPANRLDWGQAWMAHEENRLLVAYRNEEAIDLNWAFNLYLDTDIDFGTGYSGQNNEFAVGSDYLLQGRHLFRYVGDGTAWAWSYVGSAETAVSDDQAELAIPRTWLGNPQAINLFLLGDNAGFPAGDALDFYPDSSSNWDGGYFTYTLP